METGLKEVGAGQACWLPAALLSISGYPPGSTKQGAICAHPLPSRCLRRSHAHPRHGTLWSLRAHPHPKPHSRPQEATPIPGISRYVELQELAKRKKEAEQKRQDEVCVCCAPWWPGPAVCAWVARRLAGLECAGGEGGALTRLRFGG